MTTQLTEENKAKFFALYLFQEVLNLDTGQHSRNYNKLWPLKPEDIDCLEPSDCLSLRSIDQLTDREIKTLVSDVWQIGFDDWGTVNGFEEAIKHYRSKKDFPFGAGGHAMVRVIDYLRSIGILVPWLGLSCEDLQKCGWVKIKQQ